MKGKQCKAVRAYVVHVKQKNSKADKTVAGYGEEQGQGQGGVRGAGVENKGARLCAVRSSSKCPK